MNIAEFEAMWARARELRDRAEVRPARDWYKITNQAGEGGPAELMIYDEIGFWGISAADFMDELRGITAPNIDLRLNSPGGEIFDGIAIHNALRAHPATVTTYVDSLAASIASVIAVAGDQVIMQPHSQMMIHDGRGVAIGTAADMAEMSDLLNRQSDNIASIYAEQAGGQARSWRNRMKGETWYTAQEAVDAGLADRVAKLPKKGAGEAASGPPEDRWDLSVYAYAGRRYAPAPDLSRSVATAAPVHHTDTVDTTWTASTNEKRLPSPMTLATAKAAYGWYDSAEVDNGELPKAACKLPHHEVAADGTPGAANLNGVRNALSRLPQSDIPEGEQDAVRRHLQAHLDDAPSEDLADAPVSAGHARLSWLYA